MDLLERFLNGTFIILFLKGYIFILKILTLISLPLGITVLAFALPFHQESDTILLLNLYHAGILFCINTIVSFLIDFYIIFFGNVSVLKEEMAEWFKAADCKSVEFSHRRFESCFLHFLKVNVFEI